MALTHYRPLGRSGLIVSPIALGTMTFGTSRWGSGEAGSQQIFNAYVEDGGNFLDTANVYSGGRSEEMLGAFVKERQLRDQLVIATKSGFAAGNGYPYTGGNSAKTIYQALDQSLQRLGTDYVDLYWVHVWDMVTPAEELLQTLSALVRSGKIRYYGFSNTPAWYVAQLATLARVHGLPAPITLQYEYSLIQRDIENEHLPLAKEFGLGLLPWSPLGGGFLSGKYQRQDVANRKPLAQGLPEGPSAQNSDTLSDGRLNGSNPFGDSKFTQRNWQILDAVREVAAELKRTPAEVSLAWLAQKPGVASVLIGASRVEQLKDNVAALELKFSREQWQRLESASTRTPVNPSALFTPEINRFVFGGCQVQLP